MLRRWCVGRMCCEDFLLGKWCVKKIVCGGNSLFGG